MSVILWIRFIFIIYHMLYSCILCSFLCSLPTPDLCIYFICVPLCLCHFPTEQQLHGDSRLISSIIIFSPCQKITGNMFFFWCEMILLHSTLETLGHFLMHRKIPNQIKLPYHIVFVSMPLWITLHSLIQPLVVCMWQVYSMDWCCMYWYVCNMWHHLWP